METLETYSEKWDESLDEETSKEAVEGNLVPRGKYQGLLQSDTQISTISTDGGDSPFEGKKMARCHAILYTDEGEKHLWFDAAPIVVKVEGKSGGSFVTTASQNGGHLYKATKMFGKPFPDVLRYALENRLVYDIGIKKASDEYPAKNVVRGIYPAKDEEASA